MAATSDRSSAADQAPKRYLFVSGLISLGLVLLVLAGNYITDPYLMHQSDTAKVQRLQPSREKLIPWGKTYTVARFQPEVLYLGNSRTELGMPADPSLFGGKRVFNGAIPGGSLGDAIAMSVHARNVTRLETVIWGVDYPSFALDGGNTEFDRELVAQGNHYQLRRFLLDLRRSLSFDMAADTVNLWGGRRQAVCRSSLAFFGQRDEACIAANLRDRGGVAKALVTDVQAVGRKNPGADTAFPAFGSEVAQLCRQATRVVIYINPQPALALENVYQRAGGDALHQWTRQLAHTVDTARQASCDVTLFDFSGFNSVTSETIPQVSGQPAMQNFWEGSHHRTNVGRQVLARAFSLPSPPVPSDFGTKLSSGNLQEHLDKQHKDREIYRSTHRAELRLLEKWSSDSPPSKHP